MATEYPPFTSEQIETITANWSVEKDTCQDKPDDLNFSWPCTKDCKDAFGEVVIIKKTRELTLRNEIVATVYIRKVCEKYPFNVRPMLAFSMWHRFLDVFNDTGDMRKAMRAI